MFRNCVYRSARHNSRGKRLRRYACRIMPDRHRMPSAKVLLQTECNNTLRSHLPVSRSGERSYGVPFSKTIKSHVNSLQIIRWPARRGPLKSANGRGSPIWFSITLRSSMRETNSLRFNIRPEARECYTTRRKTDFDNDARFAQYLENRRRLPPRIPTAARDTYRLFARDETGAGGKKRADVYIAAEISGSRIHHLARVTSHVFRARHAVFKLQLCNTSAAPSAN